LTRAIGAKTREAKDAIDDASNHQDMPRDSVTIPFGSPVLPAWAATPRTEPSVVGEPELATWTCAKCGTVVNDISPATHYIELHRLQERTQRASARRVARLRPGTRRSLIRVECRPGGAER
jgi:hypothetical protein